MSAEPDRHQRSLERLHAGMVVELDRHFAKRGELPNSARSASFDPGVDAEVASTISTVRQVAAALVDLQETNRQQEELIYDQRRMIAELERERQTAYAQALEAERIGRTERERADRAETLLKNSESQIQRLEDYSVSMRSHLKSLMAVVRESLSAGEKVPPAQVDSRAVL